MIEAPSDFTRPCLDSRRYMTKVPLHDPTTVMIHALWVYALLTPAVPVPYDLYWSGDRVLEWEANIPVTVAASRPMRH